MSSRARSRQTNSLTNEQLQALGCVGKDIPSVPTAPPPTFPSLMNKPVTVETTSAQNYQILWKEDFLNQMRDYYLTPIPKMTADQRYSDQYNKLLENTREKCRSEIPWDIIPPELKCSGKRNLTNKPFKIKKKKTQNCQMLDRFDSINDVEVVDDDNQENKKHPSSDSEKDENEEVENEDDEMDDENDYGNNYFDNGEAFNEEDDNLDDGPIY